MPQVIITTVTTIDIPDDCVATLITSPVTSPVTSLVTSPVTSPVIAPVTSPVTDSVTAPVTDPVVDSTASYCEFVNLSQFAFLVGYGTAKHGETIRRNLCMTNAKFSKKSIDRVESVLGMDAVRTAFRTRKFPIAWVDLYISEWKAPPKNKI